MLRPPRDDEMIEVPVYEEKRRKCLNCDKVFKSYGPMNRICPTCRGYTKYHEQDWSVGSDTGFPHTGISSARRYG